MSHIWGHVEIPQQSFGVLKPISKEKIIHTFPILFTPSEDDVREGDSVGFHPFRVPWENSYLIIAIDVVKWEDHQRTEELVMKKLPEKFKGMESLEKLCMDVDGKKWLDQNIEKIGFEGCHKKVARMTMGYVGSNDFKALYFEGNNLKSTDEVALGLTRMVSLKDAGFTFVKTLSFSPGSYQYQNSKSQ